ncbi:hypothetical protein H4219_000775 [Mycoemilia scoparia]|uniref:Uncharacterized protein n=1 Tax=Mycoemilia scoparia TaxID=417184 RepID=A0A9W8A7J0_9FUNG|nr:hypothetical protein H4219_000775 [Mycoemilia scoparia]
MFECVKDKVVLITGASSGIGESCAYLFARFGSHLILTARRKDRLEKVKAKCASINPDIRVYNAELDVRDSESIDRLVESLPQDMASIDILVNNAGLALGMNHVEDNTNEIIDTVIDTNVKGLLYVTRAVLSGMKKRGKGHIINIGSIAGQSGYPGGSVYCASKFAVRAITESLRAETANVPIKVTEIAPGKVETEFSIIRFHGDTTRAAKVYEGTEYMTGDDIAESVVFAASRHERCVVSDITMLATGQVSATVVAPKKQS